MDTDKAYLFGLIIGGSVWGSANDNFQIRLPYRKWGSLQHNPQRVGEIGYDIMNVVIPMFENKYNINATYKQNEYEWLVKCKGDLTNLKQDLLFYGIAPEGKILKTVKLTPIISELVDDNLKRRFIAGIADTICSISPSHRRFTEQFQILSFEISGFNYPLVCDLCRLLYSINCIPDQILWNHPNFHSGNDPFYSSWKKGFKLRIQLDTFAEYGSFAFKSCIESMRENLQLQKQSHNFVLCPDRKLNVRPACIHPAEHDILLPDNIRGAHYLHNRHVCAVLGCENAPYEQVKLLFQKSGNYIIPFPIIHKGTKEEIENIIANESLFSKRQYHSNTIKIKKLYDLYQKNHNYLIYGSKPKTGYPIVNVLKCVDYLISDKFELSNKRSKGKFIDNVKKKIDLFPDISVKIKVPNLLTPLVIYHKQLGSLVGAYNPQVYQRLVTVSPENKYKLLVRAITEKDLNNAR
ncbi:MAG: hypothetical protein LBR53_01545 [Deltaproteobacteria bacterium]|jgi:hypothetical protein|nr:hypothetical protein [Deltaproteobacteria bacterium]